MAPPKSPPAGDGRHTQADDDPVAFSLPDGKQVLIHVPTARKVCKAYRNALRGHSDKAATQIAIETYLRLHPSASFSDAFNGAYNCIAYGRFKAPLWMRGI